MSSNFTERTKWHVRLLQVSLAGAALLMALLTAAPTFVGDNRALLGIIAVATVGVIATFLWAAYSWFNPGGPFSKKV